VPFYQRGHFVMLIIRNLNLIRSFSKTLFTDTNRRYLKTADLERKHFEIQRLFENDSFPDWVFLKLKSKVTGDCCVFKFPRRSVNGRGLSFDKQVGKMLTTDQNGKRWVYSDLRAQPTSVSVFCWLLSILMQLRIQQVREYTGGGEMLSACYRT